MDTLSRSQLELERLRSEVATLEQLLAVHENTALRQSRRLENIVNSISDGFFVLDRDWRVTWLNPVAAAFFARLHSTGEDLLGRSLWSRIPAVRGGEFEAQCRRAMSDRLHVTFECFFEPIDTHLEIHAYPWDEGLSVLFQDVTARKLADAKRDQMQAELERRVQLRTADLQATLAELESFSYSVSHDLRAPLRSLDGFSQALLEDYADQLESDGKMYLERIRANAQKMAQLIDALLQLSRVTRAEFNPAVSDLSALVRQIANEIRNTDLNRDCEFTIEDGVFAEVDPKLMEIALQNILQNAWKFTSRRKHGMIEFGTDMQDGVLACFIRDNGAGFDMKYSDKLFTAFQRLHDVREFEGTGIGLATVGRIMKRHGGKIWAEAAPDRGACFRFTLRGLTHLSAEAKTA
jgi:light-regulated signal transduction histidine kinase (bacteriophytochrome)